MSVNYTTYVSQTANLIVVSSNDPNYQTMLPGMIDYAEQRIYRELNLIATQVRDISASLSSDSRSLTLPSAFGNFVVVQDINVVTPAGLFSSTGGVRNKLAPASLDIVDFLYPTENSSDYAGPPSIPSIFAVLNSSTVVVGPPPDAAYSVEVIGTIRPSPLSSGNSSTFLTNNLPDLFMAASMIYAAGYMRDFGMQADNPQMGASWEAQYGKLFQSAAQEEIRKRYNRTFVGQYAPQQTSGGTV